jgi:acyl dehydratase
VAVGEQRRAVLVEDLLRTQIVMYAGASGDYNAIHTDEVYAREVAGQPTVMAHGMLTMGQGGRALAEWFPDGHVRRYRARFMSPVWPGDTLTATSVVRAVEETDGRRLVSIDVVVRNQDDVTVLTGEATVVLAGEP